MKPPEVSAANLPHTAEVLNFAHPSTDVTLLQSNLNLPPRLIAMAGTDILAHDIWRINCAAGGRGFDGGYEITPTRVFEVSYWAGGASDYGLRIGSLHQTWAASGREAIRGGCRPIELVGAALMRAASGSLENLQYMSDQEGVLPAVVYADQTDRATGKPRNYSRYTNDFAGLHTQLHPELFQVHGFRDDAQASVSAVTPMLREEGISGIIIDSHHLARTSRTDEEYALPYERILDAMAEPGIDTLPVTGIHLAVGRMDCLQPEDRQTTMDDLRGLMLGPEAFGRTQAGDIVRAAAEIWQQQVERHGSRVGKLVLPVVLELPFSGLAAAARERGMRKISANTRQKLTAEITDNARAFVRKALAA